MLLPPGQSPDDKNHFRRAYGIASGVFLPTVINDEGYGGSELPAEIEEVFEATPHHGAYSKTVHKARVGVSGENTFQPYPNTAIYNFICYLPQASAAFIGKTFNMPILVTAYLMRIFNFAVFAILIYFAIKLMPKFKGIMLFVALNPITLQEATSLSLDGLAIGLGMFLVAFVCYLSYTKKTEINKKELGILYLLTILIGFCKMVYSPLILLFSLIPYKRFGTKKRKYLHAILMAIIFIIINVVWLKLVANLLGGFNFNPNAEIDTQAQMAVILKDPIGHVLRMVTTTSYYMDFYLKGMLGVSLGAFTFGLPDTYFFIALGFITILFAQRQETFNIRNRDKAVYLGVFIMVLALIFTSEYLQWTNVGAPIIEGVQGRYFLPILPIVAILICRRTKKSPGMEIITESKVLAFSMFINVMAFVAFFANNI